MDSINSVIKSLDSFFNLYLVILRFLQKDSKNASVLAPVLGLTTNSMRHRLHNPHLWRLKDINQLALYYQLSTTACQLINSSLPYLEIYLRQLTEADRRKVERLCQVKTVYLSNRLLADWRIKDLKKLNQGLSQWIPMNENNL